MPLAPLHTTRTNTPQSPPPSTPLFSPPPRHCQDPDLFAWQGASRFGASPQFAAVAATRQQYLDGGAGGARRR